MTPEDFQTWVEITAAIGGLLVAFIGGLWAYTKFVVERGLLPPAEFTIDCNAIGTQAGKRIIEVLLHLQNCGGSTLVATKVNARLLYVNEGDEIDVFNDFKDKKKRKLFGRANFPHSVGKTITAPIEGPSEISVVPHDTFVRPGVTQTYTLVSAIPESATFLLVTGQFIYAQRPSRLQWFTIKLSRRLGLTQYSLDHIKKPHSIERAFSLKATDKKSAK
jgi:hypothetical protein